jgi:hypothetical protein
MIPNDTWSTDTTFTKYSDYGLVRPRYDSNNPFELELGPLELNQSANHLAKQWWLFEEVGGDVFIDKIYGSVRAAAATYLFTSGPVTQLSATFDQLGKPLVFYNTGTELRLWWYDPTQEDHVTSVFGEGADPFATFDIRYSPSNQGSDALLFYVRDTAIYYRQQRDRYEVEYTTPVDGVSKKASKLIRADMTVDWRLQLAYREIPVATPPFQGIQTGFKFMTGGHLTQGEGIATDGNDYYIVSSADDNVHKFSLAGAYIGVAFSVAAEDTTPWGLCYANGKLYMVGAQTKRVYEYTLDGTYTGFNFDLSTAFANNPVGLEFDGEFFWVVATSVDTVYKFSAEGIYQNESYYIGAVEGEPKDITYDGVFYYITGLSQGISQFDASWTYIQSFATGISDERGACWNFSTNTMLICDPPLAWVYEYE